MLAHIPRVVPGEETEGKTYCCPLWAFSPLPGPHALCSHMPGQDLESFFTCGKSSLAFPWLIVTVLHVPQCLLQHCLQQLGHGSKLGVHRQTNG